ncbi:MAG: hypothetical protein U1F09_09095 [Steroidobacteraceae bacterium]
MAAILVAALLAAGCGGMIPIDESSLEDSLAQQIAPIVVGQSDRASVRAQLGKPWITSNEWRFDLFRSNDKNSTLTWIIIPVAYTTEDIRGYVLVSYDDRGAVTALDYGIGREGDMPAGTRPDYTVLRTGDVTFWASPNESSVFVSVPSSRNQDFIQHNLFTGRCRVLLRNVNAYCGVKAELDGRSAVTLPRVTVPSVDYYVVPFELRPGTHDLKLSSDSLFCSYEATNQVQCKAGDTHYITATIVPVSPYERRRMQQKFRIDFETTDKQPATPTDYGLMVYANGHWLVPTESER